LVKRYVSLFAGAPLLLLLASLAASGGEEKEKALTKEPRSVVMHPYSTNDVTFSSDGLSLFWGCGRTLHTWYVDEKRESEPICWEDAYFAALSPDGNFIALGGCEFDRNDEKTREAIQAVKEYTQAQKEMQFRLLALDVRKGDRFVALWKVKTRQRVAVMKWHPEKLVSPGPVVFSPDGRTLAAGSSTEYGTGRCRVPLWEVPSGKLRLSLEVGTDHHVSAVQFSPDGKTLATGGLARHQEFGKQENFDDLPSIIKLWDVATGKMRTEYKGMKGWIRSVAFSPDGKLLAAAGELGKEITEVVLWDVAKGERRATLTGHRGSVRQVAFSHDGKLLASAGGDEKEPELKLWDVKTWQEIRSLKGHKDSLTSVAFSPDDSMLASSSRDGTVRLWYLRQPTKGKKDP
jgi:WD40 repeat protein